MVFAGMAAACWSLAARLDMVLFTWKGRHRQYTPGIGASLLPYSLSDRYPPGIRGHEKASRVAPARPLARPGGQIRTYGLTTPASGRCRRRGSRRWTG